jgi:hypothetical protein
MTSLRMTRMVVGISASAMLIAPAAFLASPASAGGGTGITATSATTLIFDGGNTSAKFVRAASGIINETNRVGLNGTAQNPWSPFEVYLQFRPLTGPDNTGSPKPNPACDQSGLVTSFTWHNTDTALVGTPLLGLFINSNPYNVCVYYTHTFGLSLLGNGSTTPTVNVGEHVFYTGSYAYGGTPIAGAPVTLTVWTGFGCSGSATYSGISAGLTNASGNYSFDGGASPFGLWSVRASAPNATSNCINITVNHVYGVDLSVAPNPVVQGNSVVFSSHLLRDLAIDSTDPATITVFAYGTDSTCTTPAGYGPFATIFNGVDTYLTLSLGATAPPGNYYYQAQAVGAFGTVMSGCIALTINNYSLTMLSNGSTSGVSYAGQNVTYSGSEMNGASPVASDPVTLTVWSGYGCSGAPAGSVSATTDLTGAYSYNAGNAGVGLWSIQASTVHATSSCLNLTELANYNMTLLANGGSTAAVSLGGAITYSGDFTYNGVGVGSQSVDMTIYTGAGCTGLAYATLTGVTTTDGAGHYQWGPNSSTQAGIVGTWYLKASTGANSSNCVTVTVS